jgi:cupin 2 domain-containing protein
MTLMKNLFADIPNSLPEELTTVLLESPDVCIERIVSQGHKSPEGFWYDQDQSEWVLLISGAARLEFENESIDLTSGSFLNIPAHRRHRVAWTDPNQPTIWLAVHCSAH